MSKKYTIMRIDEPDFGCEGIPDGKELVDIVHLKDSLGNKTVIEAEDRLLYELNLNEGDEITVDENGGIVKADKH